MRPLLPLLVFVGFSAVAAEKVPWEAIALRWVGEVGHPELERCADAAGGRGRVLLRLNQKGEVAIDVEQANAALQSCVEMVRVAWGASSVSGGYVVPLRFPDAATKGDHIEWREAKPSFSPCERFMDCGAGQVCSQRRGVDGGVCLDALAAWRLGARSK